MDVRLVNYSSFSARIMKCCPRFRQRLVGHLAEAPYYLSKVPNVPNLETQATPEVVDPSPGPAPAWTDLKACAGLGAISV